MHRLTEHERMLLDDLKACNLSGQMFMQLYLNKTTRKSSMSIFLALTMDELRALAANIEIYSQS
jgi:hypothetical protein